MPWLFIYHLVKVDLSTIRQALLKKHTGHFSLVASVHKNYLQMVSGTKQPLLGQACILINIRTENSSTLPPTLTPKPGVFVFMEVGGAVDLYRNSKLFVESIKALYWLQALACLFCLVCPNQMLLVKLHQLEAFVINSKNIFSLAPSPETWPGFVKSLCQFM